MVQSTRVLCSVGVRLPPTMVNISISPSGVRSAPAAARVLRQLIGHLREAFVDLRARPIDIDALREFEGT